MTSSESVLNEWPVIPTLGRWITTQLNTSSYHSNLYMLLIFTLYQLLFNIFL